MEEGNQPKRRQHCERTQSALSDSCGLTGEQHPYFPLGKLSRESQGNAVMVRQAEQSSLTL